jgi:hypothetical protein
VNFEHLREFGVMLRAHLSLFLEGGITVEPTLRCRLSPESRQLDGHRG